MRIRRSRFAFVGLMIWLGAGLAVSAHADTVLITGANSGLGLEFARQYAERGWSVIATHRRAQAPDTLARLAGAHPNVRIEQMDVTDDAQIDALAAKLQGTPIDVLINNAGIAIIGEFTGIGNNVDQSLGTLNYEHFATIVATNVKGPIKVSEAFVKHVKASKQKKIVAISSASGMVTGTPRGGMYWYGMSKAALNKLMVTLAADLKDDGVTVVMFHPGAVRVEKFAELDFPGMIEPELAIGNMIRTIDGLTIAETGRFLQNNGTTQPW